MTAADIVKTVRAHERRGSVEPGSEGTSASARSAGADHVEDLLAAIFAGALGVEEVHRDLGFSALGGDSLAATRVLSRVWRALGVKLPLSALAPDGSVRTLTAAVRGARPARWPRETPVPRRIVSGAEQLAPNQAAVWLLQSQYGTNSLYNIPHCLKMRGPLDIAALRVSLGALVVDHEALRLRIELQDGRLWQQPVEQRAPLDLPIVDLSGIEGPARARYALALAEAHVRVSFDLARPPLLRALVIKLAHDEHMLVLAIHHIACDAWSIKVMMRQLASGLAGVTDDTSSDERPGFLDFVAWQRGLLADDDAVARMVSEWRALLGESREPLALPDRERPCRPSGAGAIEPIELNAELVGDLRRFSGDIGVTLYMTLVSAFAVVLAGRAKTDGVTVGAAVANRCEESLEDVVGYLANMLPLRIDCSGDPTLRELLSRVREVMLFAYDYQELPLALLVRDLAPPRRPGVNPLFQVALILNDLSAPTWEPVEVSELTLHTGTAKLDLTCYLEERASGMLCGYLEYATDLFFADTIRGLRAKFETVLSRMLEHVDRPVSEVIASL